MLLAPNYPPLRLIVWMLLLLGITSIQAAPSISAHPQPITVAQNVDSSFSVMATGTGTLTYQWQKDGVDIPGATSSTFSVGSARPWHIGDYTVKVRDSNGTVTSNTATLSIQDVQIGLWSKLLAYYRFSGAFNDDGVSGQLATSFNAGFLTDRWSQQGTSASFGGNAYIEAIMLPDAQSITISCWFLASNIGTAEQVIFFEGDQVPAHDFMAAIRTDGKIFFRTKDNDFTVTTDAVTPDVWHHAVFCADAVGDQKTVWIDGIKKGENNTWFGQANVGNHYKLILGNTVDGPGNVFNSYLNGRLDDFRVYTRALAAADIQSLYLYESTGPQSLQIQSVTVAQNAAASFTVTATGTASGTSSYQWEKDGVNIPGAASSTYSLASAKPWHIGDYTVRVNDFYGTVTSNVATLNLAAINGGLWRGLICYQRFNDNFIDDGCSGQPVVSFGVELADDRFTQSNKAAFFGGNAYLETTYLPDASSATVSCWFLASNIGVAEQVIFFEGDQADAHDFMAAIRTDGKIFFRTKDNDFTVTTDAVTPDVWHHAVFCADAVGDQKTVWIDGIKKGENNTWFGQANVGNHYKLILGNTVDGPGNVYNSYLNGRLDDFRVYSRPLSPSEVTALYAAENAPNNWRQTHFGSSANTGSAADGADPDHDGLLNLLEYALNLSPKAASQVPASVQPAGGNLEYTYTRGTAAYNGGTVFQVEWSDDLTTWFSTGVVESLLSDDGTLQQVKATLPAGSSGRRFVRLRVE